MTLNENSLSLNAVIGFYSGYTSLDTEKGGLRVFVETFRKYNKVDFIIVTLVLPINCSELVEFCNKHNCIIEPVILDDVKTGNRWVPYKSILEKERYSKLEKILVMDMNDAMFTGDPFLIECKDKLYCAAEKTLYNIKAENHNMNSMKINTNWMNKVNINGVPAINQYGKINDSNLEEDKPKNYSERCIFNKPVLCSGSILGKKDIILKLFEWSSNLTGADQGMLNIYAYLVNSSNCIIPNLNVSDILTMDSLDFNKELTQDIHGFILNKLNKRYSICHQIDRGCNLEHFLKLGDLIKNKDV